MEQTVRAQKFAEGEYCWWEKCAVSKRFKIPIDDAIEKAHQKATRYTRLANAQLKRIGSE